MKATEKFYRGVLALVTPIVRLLYPMSVGGREALPEGAAILCANHSHFIDPVLVAVACGKQVQLHFMAKAELFKRPFTGWLLRKCGAFPVRRGEQDVSAVRTLMQLLKNGGKVLIFPEGTRVSEADAAEAKSGAVRFAAKLNVPLVPIHVPRSKKLFRRLRIRIGTPYFLQRESREGLAEASRELMGRIEALG